MSEDPQPSKTPEPTPEQLLKLLDVQIATARARRKDTRRNRTVLVVGAVLLILGAALMALLILQQMIAEMPRPARTPEPPANEQKSQ